MDLSKEELDSSSYQDWQVKQKSPELYRDSTKIAMVIK